MQTHWEGKGSPGAAQQMSELEGSLERTLLRSTLFTDKDSEAREGLEVTEATYGGEADWVLELACPTSCPRPDPRQLSSSCLFALIFPS